MVDPFVEIVLRKVIRRGYFQTWGDLGAAPVCSACDYEFTVVNLKQQILHSSVVGEIFVIVDLTGVNYALCMCSSYYE